tara:strand:+ start:2618 stop:3079 length:462 start_codon:yes stop_codon:yes gene_type:complete
MKTIMEKEMTNKKESIYNKLYEIQQEVGGIKKTKKNSYHKNTYFDINELIEHLIPLFKKHNLLLLQPIENEKQYSRIIDLDGGMVESSLALPADLNAQKIGGAITYYRRYTLVALLGLQAEDDDGNVASGKHNYKKGTNEGNISSFESDGFGV